MLPIKLKEIQVFVAVAEAGSVQLAAERLYLTQSAVTRLVQRLETTLGATLLDRRSKPLRLTRDGERALIHCRQLLSATQQLSAAFTETAEPQGPLRLGVTHALSLLLTASPLTALTRTFPRLELQLISDWSNVLIDRVRQQTLDLAAVLLPAQQKPSDAMSSRRLGIEPISVIGQRTTTAQPLSLPQLNARGWVLQPSGCGYRHLLTEKLRGLDLSPKVVIEAFGQELLLSLVARGFGYGLSPLRLLNTPLAHEVAVIPVKDFAPQVAVWLISDALPSGLLPIIDTLGDSLENEINNILK